MNTQLTSPVTNDARSRRGTVRTVAIVCGILAVPAAATANPALTVCGLAVIPLIFALLWRSNEPSVLLFAASFQWMQVFMPILAADRKGVPLTVVLGLRKVEVAAWLGLATIVVLAIGMRVGLGKKPLSDPENLARASSSLDLRRLTVAYVVSLVLSLTIFQVAAFIPGLRQQLLALGIVRWAVIFLIGWSALRYRVYRTLAIVVLVCELLLGFTGYFSAFKTILFLAMILISATGVGLRRFLRLRFVAVVLLGVLLMSFWQVVKPDYRSFVSEGQRAQVVLVPVSSRFSFLLDRASSITFADLTEGFETGLDRLGYLEFFSGALDYVPVRVPFQNGRLWFEALKHIAMPRLFFPEKEAIDDSARTREFTGWLVATAAEGASISLGYAAESYVDFGQVGMFVPIFLLGWMWGWVYQWLAKRTRHSLLGIAFSTNLILGSAMYFEASNIKLVGGTLSSFLVLWILLRYGGDSFWRFVAPRTVGSRVDAQPTARAERVVPATV
jgi:hypothetical protein